ncbi:hypothetical protein HAZT_HAZT000723 [Hyalella azteca]|uniref:Homeobox domain-containing protein n=1 Tax=Hyalella azteca TaxID=294128 RepID=A0A6A0H5F7_HYAAZ|nr:hypothetical protein HAZT_HAZT000723 [Hyalella azteca]
MAEEKSSEVCPRVSGTHMFSVDNILSGRIRCDKDMAVQYKTSLPPDQFAQEPEVIGATTRNFQVKLEANGSSKSTSCKRKIQKVYPLHSETADYHTSAAGRCSQPPTIFPHSAEATLHNGKMDEPVGDGAYYCGTEPSPHSPPSPFYDSGVSDSDSPSCQDPKCLEPALGFAAAGTESREACDMGEFIVVDTLSEDETGKPDGELGPEKKRKKKRRVLFSKQQTRELERRFFCSYYISPQERDALAKELQMDPDQVKIWFQNHRYKMKKLQKENGDRGFTMPIPHIRGGPYPTLIRDMRRPELIKDGLYYDAAKEHALGDYIRDTRLFDAAKTLNPAFFSAPGHPKHVVSLNRIMPAYSAPVMPLAHTYPYDISFQNYYLNPSAPLLGQGQNPLARVPINPPLPGLTHSLPSVPQHPIFANSLHFVY